MSGDSDAEFDLIRVDSLESKVLRFRRERIATAALQAMELPNGLGYSALDWKMGHPKIDAALAAKLALIHADALIAELDKEK